MQWKKMAVDLYATVRSLYLQDRKKKLVIRVEKPRPWKMVIGTL